MDRLETHHQFEESKIDINLHSSMDRLETEI